ncbi:MAG: winged helix-turn-helix domain-containing protein [Prevotella sp.]
MDKKSIGNAAGIVWHILSETNSLTYLQLKQRCNLSDYILNAAIGWLAREDKIEIEYDDKRGVDVIHLTPYNIYF